jgi:hypothetical protein
MCHSYTPKMEILGSPETSVHVYRTTQRRIPDNHNTYIHHYENIKSHKDVFFILFLYFDLIV